MKRIILATVLALASASAFAEPALVIRDEGCGMLNGNGQVVFTTETHRVVTNSANGNAVFRCNATVAPASSGRAAHFDFNSTGLLCAIGTASGIELTDDWNNVVSASGEARLTCRYRD